MYTYEKITITVPNKDTYIGFATLCPKCVLQKSYTNKIGKTIYYDGTKKIVKDVRVTEEYIYIDLE